MKRFYVTKKKVESHINSMLGSNNRQEITNETERIIKELKEYPNDNKNQIRYYTKMLEILKTELSTSNI